MAEKTEMMHEDALQGSESQLEPNPEGGSPAIAERQCGYRYRADSGIRRAVAALLA